MCRPCRAYRALNGIDHPKLGKFLVSFANPAKPSELSGNQGRDRPQGGMRLSGVRRPDTRHLIP